MKSFVAVLLALAAIGYGGETGKLAGRVLDKKTGEPLAGASVVVEGMTLGAATDAFGFYAILNVPAGTYAVEGSMVGFQSMTVTDVRVEPNHTTRLDLRLAATTIEMPRVVVRAERPLVSKEMVAAQFTVQSEQIAFLPGDRLSDVMLFSTGVARTESTFHVRGGRATEVDYLIDGVSVIDPLTGEFGIELSKGVADEVVFLPGGFSAEYGRAMSGVINMVTVNPRSQFGAAYRLKSEKPMPYYYDFGYSYQGLQLHLPATRNLRAVFNVGATTIGDWDPRLFRLPHKGRADYSLYGKGVWDLSGKLKLTASAASARAEYDRYQSQWKLLLDDYRSDMRHGSLGEGKLTYMPDSRSYFNLAVSRFYTDKTFGAREPGPVDLWQDFAFRDTSEYARPVIDEHNPWKVRWNRYWYFYTTGTYDQYRRTSSETWTGTLSGSAQVTPHHQLSFGAEGDFYGVGSDWVRWIRSNSPFLDTYHFRPSGLSAYFEDKLEHEGLFANLGLRYDRLNPNATFRESLASQSGDTNRLPASAKSRVSPRLGASFRITEWLFARANFGYYVQFPLFSSLYDNTVRPTLYRTSYHDSLLLVGNPDLKPERTQSYEIGLQGEVARGVAVTGNLWRKDVYDLVGTHEVPTLPQSYVTYVNIDYARLTGIEMILDLRKDWVGAKLSYTLSYARGTSSYANQAYYEFIMQGQTVPMVEYPLDFDQRNRFFCQVDATAPRASTRLSWLNAVIDSLSLHVLGYVGNGFPYSPPGGKGDPATWNTIQGPWRSNVDAVITKPFPVGRLRLDLVVEILNVLDIRDVLYVYPRTGLPDDDGERFYYYDFEFVRQDREITPTWFGDQYEHDGYDPARDRNHDGYVSADEAQFAEYERVKEYHKAAIDWVNNYGPPRRARLGFTLSF